MRGLLGVVSSFSAQIFLMIMILSLASIGPEKVKVKIVADPRFSGNVHEVVVEGEFGRLCCITENTSTPENPKTSFLASLSALRMLKKLLKRYT